MKVGEIMDEKLHCLKPQDRVIDFVSLMENHNVHEAPVINEKNELIGFVHYRILAEKNVQDPTKTRIETVMIHAPKVSVNEDAEEAIKFLFETGFRALPVVDESGKLIGMFSVTEALRYVKDEKIFSQRKCEEIMSPAIVIRMSDDIGRARVLMREKNISTLPVVNEEDKLVGVVTVLDLLKAVQPKERISWYSMAAEKLTLMQTPVSTVMDTAPLLAEKDTSVKDVIEKMIESGKKSCIVVEDSGPVGVITTRDVLELYLSTKKPEGVYVQYSGVRGEDEEIMLTVDRMVGDTVRKIHSVYPVQYFHMHVKKYRKTGERKLYSVRCRVLTDEGVFISHAQAWDLRDAVGEALDNLEKAVIKHKEREETSLKPRGV